MSSLRSHFFLNWQALVEGLKQLWLVYQCSRIYTLWIQPKTYITQQSTERCEALLTRLPSRRVNDLIIISQTIAFVDRQKSFGKSSFWGREAIDRGVVFCGSPNDHVVCRSFFYFDSLVPLEEERERESPQRRKSL